MTRSTYRMHNVGANEERAHYVGRVPSHNLHGKYAPHQVHGARTRCDNEGCEAAPWTWYVLVSVKCAGGNEPYALCIPPLRFAMLLLPVISSLPIENGKGHARRTIYTLKKGSEKHLSYLPMFSS